MKTNQSLSGGEIQLERNCVHVSKTDLKGEITYCNQELVSTSGFSEQELLGSSHGILRHPDMPSDAFAGLWNALRQGRPWTGTLKNRTKDGGFYWVQTTISPRPLHP